MKTQMRSMLIFGVLLSLSFVISMTASADQEPLPALFSDPASSETRTEGRESAEVIRSREAEVDTDLLAAEIRSSRPGELAFELNFFEDASFQAAIQQVVEMENGSFGLVGVVDSPEYNELVMVLRGDAVQAYLQVGGQTFEIRYHGLGHTIVEVDQSGYPDSLPPAVSPYAGNEERNSTRDAVAADTGDRIDVLAVYTPAARDALGGVSAVEIKIQESILSSNTGFSNSGINFEFRLVGMELVNYDEYVTGVTNAEMWQYALRRLTFGYYPGQEPEANYLADARAYREQYGADLVFMVTDLPYSYCGLGWLGGDSSDEDIGYSVVHRNCTGGTNYSAQHEMGHNMGACHDRANTSSTSLPHCYYNYSFGYQNIAGNFYTVMAYSCSGCSRINRWSNPDIPYGGLATGIPVGNPLAAHNALSLNNRAYTVANYRQEPNPVSGSFVSPLDGGRARMPRTNLEVTASSSAGSISSVEFGAYYDGSWHSLGTDSDGGDGWGYEWNTVEITEQVISLRAVIYDSLGNDSTIEITSVTLSPTMESSSGSETRGVRPSGEQTEGVVEPPEPEVEAAIPDADVTAPEHVAVAEETAVPLSTSKWMADEPRVLP